MSFDYKSFIGELKSQGIVIGDEAVGYKINPYLEMPKGLEFSEVGIKQERSEISSRLDTDVKSEVFRGFYLEYPMLASNMMAVTNAEFCVLLRKLGALGVLHRGFPNEELYLSEVRKISSVPGVSDVAVSVGAGGSQVELAAKLVLCGATVIFVDVAHGYSKNAIWTGRQIKKNHHNIKLVIGNTINPNLMYEVNDFADAVKVSIGNGSSCETRFTAGCYTPPFTVLQEFKDISKKLGLPIIQDGGISNASDFVKAIGAGANSVMMGRNFAMCPESAARAINWENCDDPAAPLPLEIENDSELKKMWFGAGLKEYFGMASRTAQDRWRGGLKEGTCSEGKRVLLAMGEPAAKLIERYSGALRSGMTYVGAQTVSEFQEKVKFVRI